MQVFKKHSPLNAIYKNKEWLIKKYIDEKLSTVYIAKICKVCGETILYQLKKNNITRRSFSESVHLAKANHCDLSIEALHWLYGELLGDGCLYKVSPYSARFQYASKHKEYIQYISNSLKSFGIKQSGRINKHKHKKHNSYYYSYKSYSYIELLPIYNKWYPDGKKIVPKDIVLTPLVCRQWYIGDGTLKCPVYERPSIRLCTNGFKVDDVNWLVKQLNKLGFKATRQPADNIIHILVDSVEDFLNYIGGCPVKCYEYKWNCIDRIKSKYISR